MQCVSCADDCHPGRIKGNPPAMEECKKNCGCKSRQLLLLYTSVNVSQHLKSIVPRLFVNRKH